MTFSEAKTMLEEYRKHNMKLKEINEQIEVFRSYMEPQASVITGLPKSGLRKNVIVDNLIRISELQEKAECMKYEKMELMSEVEERLLLMESPYSTVLRVRYCDGQTIESTSEKIGICTATVKNYTDIGIELFSDLA